MARTRDVVVAVIIGGAFLVAFAFFALMFVGLFSSSDGIDLAGLGDNVGVVDLFGTIEEASGRIVIEQLDRWADNNSIEAVVIHINSPGGGVAISQEVFDAVSRLAAEKPVVAAMAEVAASGGYYVACGADRIVAKLRRKMPKFALMADRGEPKDAEVEADVVAETFQVLRTLGQHQDLTPLIHDRFDLGGDGLGSRMVGYKVPEDLLNPAALRQVDAGRP